MITAISVRVLAETAKQLISLSASCMSKFFDLMSLRAKHP